jgi:hypothetical protein
MLHDMALTSGMVYVEYKQLIIKIINLLRQLGTYELSHFWIEKIETWTKFS